MDTQDDRLDDATRTRLIEEAITANALLAALDSFTPEQIFKIQEEAARLLPEEIDALLAELGVSGVRSTD